MEITPPPKQQITPPLATSKTELLSLKLNQQLDVKIISSDVQTKTLALLSSLSNNPIQVQSNLAIETKPGQTLQLLVTKTTPSAEFKIIASKPETQAANSTKLPGNDKQTSLKALILKQIIPPAIILKNSRKTDSSINITPTVISAKIISVTEKNIQLQLNIAPSKETSAYTKKLQQNILQQHNPTITVKKEQLLPNESLTTQNSPKQLTAELQSFKLGQTIQLEVSKEGLKPEFKIINNLKHNLFQGQVVTAKVIELKNDKVQLALFKDAVPETKNKLSPIISAPANKPNQLITVSTRQLSYAPEKTTLVPSSQPSLVNNLRTLKPEQTLILEVKNAGTQPEFKIIETNQPKLKPGQVINANVIEIKNNKVQLQIQFPTNTPAANHLGTSNKLENQSTVIFLNKSQIASSTPKLNSASEPHSSIDNKNLSLDLKTLHQGQNIKLEVIKIGIQTEFKLIENTPNPEKTILNTIKQSLPIQQPPTELINQIIKNLAAINKNEKIPDTLKRIAREIIESLPHTKNLHHPEELKQSIRQSGQFLEAKLAQYSEKKEAEIESDFKRHLLKLRHAIKQELEVKKDQKSQSSEINLIKEIQQKTESTLAKIILNQLTSLPKDDAPRQVWSIDLPFINKDTAASVKIEIDQEQQSKDNERQLNWTVSITATPPELGTIHCKISCFDKTINTRFWSDNQDSVTKIAANLDYLKNQFETAGINPGLFTVHSGIPSKESPQKIIDQNLLDQEV